MIICIPLLILRSLGLVELFENVRALSENRSNKIFLISFQNIENSPPNPGISWLNKWILQILYKPSNIYYSIYVDQILLYAVFDLSQQSCKTRDYCKYYFISRKMYLNQWNKNGSRHFELVSWWFSRQVTLVQNGSVG